MMDDATNYPLSWPASWPRTSVRESSRFGSYRRARPADSVHQSVEELLRQFELMGVEDWNVIISSNIPQRRDGLPRSDREPVDPAVAVYFRFHEEPRVMACDKWDRASHNIWAIVKHVEALRGIDRWGVGSLEQAFAGYTALPESAGGKGWWEILGVDAHATPDEIDRAFKIRAVECHPDTGGNHDDMAELTQARTRALAANAG